LLCVVDPQMPKIRSCRRLVDSGSLCDGQHFCLPPLACAGPVGQAHCAPVRHAGESCTPGWRQCEYPLGHCGSERKCVDTPVDENEECGLLPSGEWIHCTPGSECKSPNGPGKCGPPPQYCPLF
jgi:hypothetical protein